MSIAIPRAEVASNIDRARELISSTCNRVGRDPGEVTIVAVTKTFPPSAVDDAMAAGIHDIGENRVQELAAKISQVTTKPRWHMIGHLQSNKVKDAVRMADVIQTVDSISLAERIGREAMAAGREISVLIQVNVGKESQKSGVAPDGTLDLARAVMAVKGIHLKGLMAIPPMTGENEVRGYFRAMKGLSVALAEVADDASEISMGMSGDFVIAVEEGATMVRLGSYLFGSRS